MSKVRFPSNFFSLIEKELASKDLVIESRMSHCFNKEKIESVEKAYALAKNIKQGVTDIDNVPTKHYLKEELELLLTLDGFTVDRVEKINYTWKTEFNNPPKWLQEPYPWDWMCVAKKL